MTLLDRLMVPVEHGLDARADLLARVGLLGWLGHPLHLALSDVPMGAWTTALALDAVGQDAGADVAVAVGLAGAAGAVVTGVASWRSASDRRLGAAHAVVSGGATVLYAGSLWLRWRGARRKARWAGLAGFGLAVVAGALGGRLADSFRG